MKKSIFTLWLLAISVLCLSACGNKKDFNMSFEEALELASHSSIQDVMTNIDNAEQAVSIAWTYDKDGLKVDGKLTSQSKQNLKDLQSESNIAVDLKVQQKENNFDIKWDLDIKFVPSAVYLSLNSLNAKWEESIEWIAWIASWYLKQWFSIPLNETIDINSLNMKDKLDLSSKIKDVINNEWLQVYNGKFTDYNGYNARKISIDDEKLMKILKDNYNSLENTDSNAGNESISMNELTEDSNTASSEVSEENVENAEETAINNEIEALNSELDNTKIENFEWYLVIIWKDKVALAIDNMDITNNGETTNLNWLFSDKDVLLSVFSEWEEVITLTAIKKGSSFDTSLNLSGLCFIWWTITPKISSSKIDISFDLSITITADEKNTIIPLKGSWTYSEIPEFKVEVPSESTDLTEMLWGLFWWVYGWWDELDYSYYDDYDLNSEDLYNDEFTAQEENTYNETSENNEENIADIEESNAEVE